MFEEFCIILQGFVEIYRGNVEGMWVDGIVLEIIRIQMD